MAGATMIRFKQLGFSPKSWEEWTLEQIRILIESEKKGDVGYAKDSACCNYSVFVFCILKR